MIPVCVYRYENDDEFPACIMLIRGTDVQSDEGMKVKCGRRAVARYRVTHNGGTVPVCKNHELEIRDVDWSLEPIAGSTVTNWRRIDPP
jgi:hypothetical protein